jgi:hypothetical protein
MTSKPFEWIDGGKRHTLAVRTWVPDICMYYTGKATESDMRKALPVEVVRALAEHHGICVFAEAKKNNALQKQIAELESIRDGHELTLQSLREQVAELQATLRNVNCRLDDEKSVCSGFQGAYRRTSEALAAAVEAQKRAEAERDEYIAALASANRTEIEEALDAYDAAEPSKDSGSNSSGKVKDVPEHAPAVAQEAGVHIGERVSVRPISQEFAVLLRQAGAREELIEMAKGKPMVPGNIGRVWNDELRLFEERELTPDELEALR